MKAIVRGLNERARFELNEKPTYKKIVLNALSITVEYPGYVIAGMPIKIGIKTADGQEWFNDVTKITVWP